MLLVLKLMHWQLQMFGHPAKKLFRAHIFCLMNPLTLWGLRDGGVVYEGGVMWESPGGVCGGGVYRDGICSGGVYSNEHIQTQIHNMAGFLISTARTIQLLQELSKYCTSYQTTAGAIQEL